MKSTIFFPFIALLTFTGHVLSQQTPTSTAVALKAIQTLDCYKTNGTLTKMKSYDFATDGWCQQICGGANYPVMGMTAGSTCYCGSEIPPLDQSVPESDCDTPCNGYNLTNCGGIGYWQVYLTGLTNAVQTQPNGSVSASGSSGVPTVTKVAETVVVTSAAAGSSSNSGTNKVGIAVGVVVAVVGVAISFGALVFYLKQKQRRAIEDEHRRLEAAAAAAAAEKNSDAASTHTDQRLDPSNIFSHRRESIGSIADEMDFSRRILQVRNPDRFSTNSPVP